MKLHHIILALLVSLLFSCKQNTTEPTISSKDAILSIQDKLISAFWRASDKTLRENTELSGHRSTEEAFLKEHICSLYSAEKIPDTNDYKAIFRITIPEIKNAFYELTFTGNQSNWKAVDGRTQIGPKTYNYFSGKFLGNKSLEPYLVDELQKLGATFIKAQ